MALKLVILAAGLGSRYGGLKQLDTFGAGAHALMEYGIYDAKRAGFDSVVFVIRKDFAQEFQQKIWSRIASVMPAEYAYQECSDLPAWFVLPEGRTRPWWTGHALLSARDLLRHDSFVVINADDFYSRESYQVAADFMRDPANHGKSVLVGYVLEQVLSEFGGVNRGMIIQTAEGHLRNIIETKNIQKIGDEIQGVTDVGAVVRLQADQLCSMNMIGFWSEAIVFAERYFVDFLKEKGCEQNSEFYLPSILQSMVDDEGIDVPVLRTHSKWFGLTYQEDKQSTSEAVDALIAAWVYPPHLW